MSPRTYFEELSYALRRRELLPRSLEEDGLPPVEWNGCILCRVTKSGAVRYDPTWVDTSRAKAALAQATEAARTVMEYMMLLENVPPLKADGLADDYWALVEFSGTVLAGTETLLGVQFVTWARDYDRSGVNNGHYYMESYQGAREDLAPRSGLVAREWVFGWEQLEGLRQATQGSLHGEGPFPISRSSNAGASWTRSQPSCRKESRIRCRVKVRSLNSPCEDSAKSGVTFSIQKLLVSPGLWHFFRYVWWQLYSVKAGIVVVRNPPENNEEDTHMKQIEEHPAPEKLFQQVTEEATNALALGGSGKIGDEAPMEAGAELIAKAWEVPRESLQASLELIERERQLLCSGNSEDALPNSELLKSYDGKMTAEPLWGLFETTARLEDAQDRAAMYKLALLMAESLNLDSWIVECGSLKIWDGNIQEGGCPWTAPLTFAPKKDCLLPLEWKGRPVPGRG